MDFQRVIAQLQETAGFAAARAREAATAVQGVQGTQAMQKQELERVIRDVSQLSGALAGLSGKSFGSSNVNEHVRYIEAIPGRRIPFDMVCSIPIGANVTAEQQGTKTISQDGPFVAVARLASFQSAYQVAYRDPVSSAISTFQGRSYGRWRPIHSAWDLNDAQPGPQPAQALAFPGTGAPIYASPSNHSSFRTMQFDGVIEMLNQGAAYPRSNDPIPSAFYSESINSAFQLGALDFFERGETIQWKVRPTHVNNPPAGNASGYAAGGVYPFLASQYDVHEGVVDPTLAEITTDPITRLPQGILVVALHGFKIVQPPGPVRMT